MDFSNAYPQQPLERKAGFSRKTSARKDASAAGLCSCRSLQSRGHTKVAHMASPPRGSEAGTGASAVTQL